MKKLLIILFAAAILWSCKKDEPKPEKVKRPEYPDYAQLPNGVILTPLQSR